VAGRTADVAVLLPVGGGYTYRVPDEPAFAALGPGARVWVPFGGRGAEGVVLSVGERAPTHGAGDAAGLRLKAIARIVDGPPLDPSLLSLARWIANYYMAPLGEALRLLLPPGGRAADARRAALTDEGRRAAESIGRALEPASLDGLGLRERALLSRLLASGGADRLAAIARDGEGAAAAVRTLVKRGLVELASEVRARREREEAHVRALPLPSGEPPFGRSAARRALYERLVASGGEAPLSSLRAVEPRARELVRALAEAGLVAVESRPEAAPSVEHRPIAAPSPFSPTAAQRRALDAIEPAIDAGGYAPFLLHGATGSGKTEVYLRAIERTLARGRGALALVPEISLTPQLAARFRARFGDAVAVLHSSLGARERFDAWSRLRAGRVRIALGARSAVFAPVADLGIVIVDEEHDGSFKQEDGVRYHGRDVAMRRARDAGAVAILGSATPSLESYEAARAGRLTLLALPERATPRPLPSVEVVDLRRFRTEKVDGEPGLLSAPLLAALEETLGAGEQAILFLNRRGFATFVLCTACGHRFSCRHCAVTLTYHRGGERLACHYCGYLEAPPARCPECHAQRVERLGLGTERVEAQLRRRFPSARVARLDRDTAHGRGLERILDGVRAREIDLLVGTQMIAKGHDFPGVTLVGVLLADQGMGLPDFRATERSFQLLEQVAGRAGRGERPGRVVIQTFQPRHPAVLRAADHDYARFFDDERAEREAGNYPPLSRAALLRVDGEDPLAVRRAAEAAAAAARAAAAQAPVEARVEVLGPSEAPISRLKGRTRWQLFVKAATPRALRVVLRAALAIEPPGEVRLSADVDPMSTL